MLKLLVCAALLFFVFCTVITIKKLIRAIKEKNNPVRLANCIYRASLYIGFISCVLLDSNKALVIICAAGLIIGAISLCYTHRRWTENKA